MFSSPTLSRSNKQQAPPERMSSKRVIDDQSKTIEQLKTLIDELQLRHERKERELLKRIAGLYQDLQQNRKKMAHLIYKHQQQKKCNEETKTRQDSAIQTDGTHLPSICPHCSTQLSPLISPSSVTNDLVQLRIDDEQPPKYYTLQPEDDLEYISATPQASFNQSLSSPSLSATDRSSSSTKHNESSSSAYNTAESLPSSTYSDDIDSLERVLNAACTMYTTHDNLEHTIKLQEELFRQRLRLRGIAVDADDKDHQSSSSEHLYDNIDGETSDAEKKPTGSRSRPTQGHPKNSKANVSLSTDDDEHHQYHQRIKLSKAHRVRFLDQCHSMGKRRNYKSASRSNLAKSTHHKRSNSNQLQANNKKLNFPQASNMLTVTIT